MFEITLSEKTLNQEAIQTVNARDLHHELGVKDHFRNWIKSRITKYGFVENQDFTLYAGKSAHGKSTKDYHISIDMAKELSMVERNDKGKEARQYFIKVEKKMQQQQLVPTTSDVVLLAQIELEKLKLESKVKLAGIEAKVKLGKKKTDIKRIPNCNQGYSTMQDIANDYKALGQRMPISLLRAIKSKCAIDINCQGNCINIDDFCDAVQDVFTRFEDDGGYWKDTETGIRTLKSKVNWFR